MANSEHLEILKCGVSLWNRWREGYTIGDCQSDLSGGDLSGADLSGINLTSANFWGTNLSQANLSNTKLENTYLYEAVLERADLTNAKLFNTDLVQSDLRQANLHNAFLTNASLMEADLSEANFAETELFDVNLSKANLSNINFSSAQLYGVNLSEVIFEEANFFDVTLEQVQLSNVDLSRVKALETVYHAGLSYLDIHSIYRSHGRIPEVFLRGIGVPDAMISYIHTLIDSQTNYSTCFISYSSRDQDFADRLYTDLQSKGVRCWFAPEDLKIGDNYHQRIDESIRLYDKLILILSENALQSAWVEREMVAAREKEDRSGRLVLFPVRLDESVLETQRAWAADVRRRWHVGDFTRWKDHDEYQKAFNRLLRDLKAEAK